MEPRRYRGFRQFGSEIGYLLREPRRLLRATRGRSVSPAFAERLRLAVTGVNSCRYCAYAHARIALLAGVTADQACSLLTGEVGRCPDREVPAVLYALHWAESDASPDREARHKLVEVYGPEAAEEIELVLRAMRIANLSANSLDHLLAGISGQPRGDR